jgi:hypothetical protein
LYLDPNDFDQLIAHRFSAFLRQNPRAIAALDPESIDLILAGVGQLPRGEFEVHRLPARTWVIIAAVVAVALLPLAAQYAHQNGLVQGLGEPAAAPLVAPVRVAAQPLYTPHRRPSVKHAVHKHAIVAHHRVVKPVHYAIAARPARHSHAVIAWKFDPHNNPYFNVQRWRHPYIEPPSTGFAARARLSVRSYLNALVAGNTSLALMHLGLPRTAGRAALAELPIVTRKSSVAIVSSRSQVDGRELVEADIVSGGHEYFEVFHVARDGAAVRIVDRYYIPVNRRSMVAAKIHS